MLRSWCKSLISAAAATGIACCLAQAADEAGVIADNDGIIVDGRTFKVTPGKAIGDAGPQVKKLGARELGPGAIIFRSGAKLFIVDTPLLLQRASSASRPDVYVSARTERPNRIRIEYIPPKKSELQKIYESVKEAHALEALQQVFSPFRFPTDLMIRTTECGMVNAWYRLEDTGPAITLCYEYLQAIMNNVPPETTPAGIAPLDALLGQFFYVVAHEFGHAVFNIYDISVFGRAEDAADQFASFILLQYGKDRARRLVGGAAYSYRKYISALKDKPKTTIPLAAFSSTHGQPEERFYNLLCAAYGADPEEFKYLVDDNYLPKTRSPSCEGEYFLLTKAIRRHISPHIDQELAKKVLNKRWFELLNPINRIQTTGSH